MNVLAQRFFLDAESHQSTALSLAVSQAKSMGTAYHNGKYHGLSVSYPFLYGAKMMIGVGRVLYGVGLLFYAVFNDPRHAIPNVISGLFKEFATFFLNAINVILSVVSLLSRTLSTVFYGGYVANQPNPLVGDRDDHDVRHQYSTGSFMIDMVAHQGASRVLT